MGKITYDKTTKSYKILAAIPVSQMRPVDSKKISPALKDLIEAFDEVADSKGVPIEIVIRVTGREDRTYSVVLNDAQEIQEILQWGIVEED